MIKHAQATMLKVNIYSSQQQSYKILIEDNGRGFAKSEKVNGHYGLENIAFRVKELNAALTVETSSGKGTRIEINK